MIRRLLVIFFSVLFPFISFAYSGYVGDFVDLKVSVSASDIYSIDWKKWSGSTDCITLTSNWGNNATVHIDSYFTGSVKIRAQYKTMSNAIKTEYFDITCNAVNLNVSPTSMNLKVGDKDCITYTTSPSGKWPSVSYSSSNPSVASVDVSGVVTGKSKGTATITLSNSMGPNATVSAGVDSDPDPNPGPNPDPNPSITDGTWFQDYTEEGYYMLFYAYKHAYTGEMVCMVSRSPQGSSTITYANGKVTIPSYAKGIKVYMIDNAAFLDLSGLTELVIPSTVEWVGSNITLGCDNLKKVTCNATTPPSCTSSSSTIFDYSKLFNGILYVPKGCVSKYQSAKGWKEFKNIKEIGTPDDILISNISLNTTSASISVGETLQLTATVYPNNATNKSVTWSTNNNTVASVSTSGLVTAKSEGNATITCKAKDGSGVYATCVIYVVRGNSIEINSTNFPDEAFRNYLLSQDYGADGKLTESEINNINQLSIPGSFSSRGNTKSLKGIEFFTALKSLYCDFNQLTALDVSKNTALRWLWCQGNQLTTLDVSKNTALENLQCYSNQLTALDVSKNTALTTLSCSNNQLTALDVSKNTALTNLYCSSNQLTALDVSKNTALTNLDCGANQLTTLDVSKNTALEDLQCGRNQLTTLDVSKNKMLTHLSCHKNKIKGTATDNLISSLPINTTNDVHIFYFIYPLDDKEGNVGTKIQMSAAKERGWFPCYWNSKNGKYVEYEGSEDSEIVINETNFPDEEFRNYLLSQSYGADGKLTKSEISEITEIDVTGTSYSEIKTLKGIEFFTALTHLSCGLNQLTTLDVSKNTALSYLSCYYNQLTTLDVSKNTALTNLYCSSNQLTALDVSKNTALTNLDCGANQLTTLDVSKNTALETLACDDNQLTTLDVSKNTALTNLYCYSNQLTTLDVSKNTALKNLHCSYNQLTALDVSKNTALTGLHCYNNQLTVLDVSKNTALIYLSCDNNQLTALDVSKKNTALTHLDCYSNKIKGTATDNLIKSLPLNTTNNVHRFWFIYPTNESEGNVGTKAQMAAAKAKGWTPQYYNGTKWLEYEGSEDDPSGINTILMDKNTDKPIYNLSGQKLAAPQKGINIINGKKVVVK